MMEPSKPERPEVNEEQRRAILEQYGIESVESLEEEIHLELTFKGYTSFEKGEEFREDLERSFQDAFLKRSGVIALPDALAPAIEDAAYYVSDELEYHRNSSLEEVVIPKFVTAVTDLFAAYASRGLDTVAGLYFGDSGGSGAARSG